MPPPPARLPAGAWLGIGAGALIVVLAAALFVGFFWFITTVDFLGDSHHVEFQIDNQANTTLIVEIGLHVYTPDRVTAAPGPTLYNTTFHIYDAYAVYINLSEEQRDVRNLSHLQRLQSFHVNVTNPQRDDLRFYIEITPGRTMNVRGPEVWVRHAPAP